MENINYQHQTRDQGSMQRIQALANNTNEELRRQGNNSYLHSLLQPMHQAKYPDGPPPFTFTKTVNLAQDINFPQIDDLNDEFRLVWATNSPILGLFVERRGTNGQWYHHYVMQFAERIDDPERYLRYRVVSGKIALQSSTLASGQYSLNGVLNATKLAYAPEQYHDSNFDQILPYAETPSAKRMNVSIATGVSLSYPYKNECTFVAPAELKMDTSNEATGGLAYLQQTTGKSSTQRVYDSDLESKFFNNDFNVLLFECNRDANSASYDPGLAGFINTYQQHMVTFQMTYGVADQDSGLGTVQLEVGMRYLDGNNVPQTEWVYAAAYDSHTSSFRGESIHFQVPFFAYTQIDHIRVRSEFAPRSVRKAHLVIEQFNPNGSSTGAQLLVVQGKGQDPSTNFRISGIANLEVIPGTKLKPDIPAIMDIDDDNDDRIVARNFLQIFDAQMGYNGVATLAEEVFLDQEIRHLNFSRMQLSNFAFLGAILPILRGLGTFALRNAPAIFGMGQQLLENIQQARSNRFNPKGNRAMLTSSDSNANEAATSGSDAEMQLARRSRFAPAPTVVVAPQEEPDQIADHLCVGRDFEVKRLYPTLDPHEKKRVQSEVTVTSIPGPDQYQVIKTQFGQIYVQGLDSELPKEVPKEVTHVEYTYRIDASRLVQYGILFLRKTQRDSIYITFKSSNGRQVKGASFSFALEAVLFNYTDKLQYSGDSCPNFDFLPSVMMNYEVIKAKMDRKCPTIFKTVLSANPRTELPEDALVTVLNEYLLDGPFEVKGGTEFPANSILESSTVLRLFPNFQGKSGTTKRPISQPAPKVSKRVVSVSPEPKRAQSKKPAKEPLVKKEKKGDKPEELQPREKFLLDLSRLEQKMFKTFKVIGFPERLSLAMLALKEQSTTAKELDPIINAFEDVEIDEIGDKQIRSSLKRARTAQDEGDENFKTNVISALNQLLNLIPIHPDYTVFSGKANKPMNISDIRYKEKPLPKRVLTLGNVSSINAILAGQDAKWKEERNRLKTTQSKPQHSLKKAVKYADPEEEEDDFMSAKGDGFEDADEEANENLFYRSDDD